MDGTLEKTGRNMLVVLDFLGDVLRSLSKESYVGGDSFPSLLTKVVDRSPFNSFSSSECVAPVIGSTFSVNSFFGIFFLNRRFRFPLFISFGISIVKLLQLSFGMTMILFLLGDLGGDEFLRFCGDLDLDRDRDTRRAKRSVMLGIPL